jgi:peptide/nickel transport system permease protein
MAVRDAVALDVGVDTSAVTPVRRRRAFGGLFIASLIWIALVGLGAIFANLLPIPSPTEMDMLGKRALPAPSIGWATTCSAATCSPA